MNQTLKIIQELIENFDVYHQKASAHDLNLKNFARWLYEKEVLVQDPESAAVDEMHLNGELAYMISAMYKRFKSYSKKALAGSELISADEFSFLVHISFAGSFRKLEIIKLHLLETPSGFEIIKRLLSKSLIEEFDDPDDKRAKRVKLTKKGEKEIENVSQNMNEVFQLMGGNLSLEEKIQLKTFLYALNTWHDNNS